MAGKNGRGETVYRKNGRNQKSGSGEAGQRGEADK